MKEAPKPEIKGYEPEDPTRCDLGKEQWRTAGTPKRGGTLVKANAGFTHMDPSAPGRSGGLEASQVYNSLLQYRACYYSDTAAGPRLAKSWEVSADGLTWTLKLRDDVTNGRTCHPSMDAPSPPPTWPSPSNTRKGAGCYARYGWTWSMIGTRRLYRRADHKKG